MAKGPKEILIQRGGEVVPSSQLYTDEEGGGLICVGCGMAVHPRYLIRHEDWHRERTEAFQRITDLEAKMKQVIELLPQLKGGT